MQADQKEKKYIDEGSGDVFILLYGLFGSAKNFNYLADHLKENYRVIIPVFPFYDLGFSVTIFCLAEYLSQLIEELKLDKFHLLGNSMGGHIALLYTLKHPEKVESIILSGSSGLFENGMGYSFPKRKEYDYIKSKTELTFYNPEIASKELVDEIYAIVNSRKALQILSLAKSTIRNNLEKELHKIKVPCCLVWGRQDVVTPPHVAEDFKRLIPHARLYWIDECGHVPMLETPDKFNKVIDSFMSNNLTKNTETVSSADSEKQTYSVNTKSFYMQVNQFPDKRKLYRLPWSTNDNPIGWVEITDICNIHCDGCYRLVMGEGHKPLEKVKEEILFLKKWRNCDGISIAGGEPLTHPQIVEIVQFITDNGMKSLMLTNGYALKEDILIRLKRAGLTGLSFHIDVTQTRPEFKKIKPKKETDLNELRLKCAKMLRKTVGLYAHFGITVTRKNLNEVPDLLRWAIGNMDVVGGISLITYRGVPVQEGIEFRNAEGQKIPILPGSLGYSILPEEMKIANVTSKEVYAVIKKEFPGYEATSYLGGTIDHTSFKWLIGNFIVNRKGKVFGAYGSKTMELVQTYYHRWFGKYLVYPKIKMGKRIFFMSLFDKTVRKAFGKFLLYCLGNPLRFFYKVKAIGIGVIQAPDVMPDGRIDMCDDCPDMCVFEGKLVNSCRLDECRKYGSLLNISITSAEAKEMIVKSREPETADVS